MLCRILDYRSSYEFVCFSIRTPREFKAQSLSQIADDTRNALAKAGDGGCQADRAATCGRKGMQVKLDQ